MIVDDVYEVGELNEANMSSPRKFSEKIALHKKKLAEETAAFEAVLREVSATTKVGGRRSQGHRDASAAASLRSIYIAL